MQFCRYHHDRSQHRVNRGQWQVLLLKILLDFDLRINHCIELCVLSPLFKPSRAKRGITALCDITKSERMDFFVISETFTGKIRCLISVIEEPLNLQLQRLVNWKLELKPKETSFALQLIYHQKWEWLGFLIRRLYRMKQRPQEILVVFLYCAFQSASGFRPSDLYQVQRRQCCFVQTFRRDAYRGDIL